MASHGSAVPLHLADLLDRGRDSGIAVVAAGEEITYGELRRRVGRLAGGLVELGLTRGERVVLALPNGVAFVVGLVALWRAGAVPVPVDARVAAAQLRTLAGDCQAVAVICADHVFAELEPIIDQLPSLRFVVVDEPRALRRLAQTPVHSLASVADADGPVPAVRGESTDLAMLAYTSGSTGAPKGVMHSHRSLITSLVFTIDHIGICADDRVLIPIPMHHLFGLRELLSHLLAGATVIADRDLFAGLRRVDESKPNAVMLVPAAVQVLVDRYTSLLVRMSGRLRRLSIGSAAISPDALRALERVLPQTDITIPYGMTEARVGYLEPVEGRSERLVRAVDPQLEVSVRDEQWRPIAAGLGEIVLRGPGLMSGYWHDTPAQAEERRQRGFRTRDLVSVEEGGALFLVGRIDSVISVGGEKVFPLEVEAVLRAHEAVADALVHGCEDPRGVLGEVVAAAVVIRPGRRFDPDELIDHCRRQLEPYKVPVTVEPRREIARNEMGKIVQMTPRPRGR